MKTKLLIIATIGGIVGVAQNGYALSCTGLTVTDTIYDYDNQNGYCIESVETCQKNPDGTYTRIYSCSECYSVTELTRTGMITTKYLGDKPFFRCLLEDDYYAQGNGHCGDLNCINDDDWTYGNAGYMKMTKRQCSKDGKSCLETSTNYVCAPGYYGVSLDGKTGCNRCPSSGGTQYGWSAIDSADITHCYMSNGDTFSNATGSGVFTGHCEYD